MSQSTAATATAKPAAKAVGTFATKAAASLDGRKAGLAVALQVVAAREAGHSYQTIADAFTAAVVKRIAPNATPAQAAELSKTPLSKGGAGFSKPTAANYGLAYDEIVRAGVDPEGNLAAFGAIYGVVTRAGTVEARNAVVAAVQALPVGERHEAFVKGMTEVRTGTAAKTKQVRVPVAPKVDTVTGHGERLVTASDEAAKRPAPVTGDAGAVGLEATVARKSPTPVSVEVALEAIRRMSVQTWSPADRARLVEGMLEAASLLEVAESVSA